MLVEAQLMHIPESEHSLIKEKNILQSFYSKMFIPEPSHLQCEIE